MNKIKHLFSKADNLFLIICLISGGIFIFITPLLWGFDEIAHFNRVYQISEGNYLPSNYNGSQNGFIPKNLYELNFLVYADLMDNNNHSRHIDNIKNYSILGSNFFSKEYYTAPISTSYSVVAYFGPVISLYISKIINLNIADTIYFARFASLAVYMVLVWLAIKYQRYEKLKWLLFVVALMPVSIFQASMVTVDGIAIALSVLFISLLLNIIDGKPNKLISKKYLLIISLVGVMLPLAKFNYIFLTFGLILIPKAKFASAKISYIYKTVSILVAVIISGLWTFITKPTRAIDMSPRPDGLMVSPPDQLNYILTNPIDYTLTFIKTIIYNGNTYYSDIFSLLGWNYVRLPALITALLSILIFIAVINTKSLVNRTKNKILMLNIFIFAGIASIFAILYIAFTPVSSSIVDGVQGRYFIPFLLPILLLIALFIPIKLEIGHNKSALFFGLTISAVLIISILNYYKVTY